jgi:N-acetylglucosamine kinase-like BadF-type ATPase
VNYFVGIDGGGTRTTAVLTDESGQEVTRLEGEAGIVNVLDPEAGAQTLADLTSATLAKAGITARASGLVCALAGAGREPERTRLEKSLAAQGVAVSVNVASDFEAALQDAFGDGSGILVIAGTGSSSWARHADGRTARAGGWGHILGDEGSGYAIGLAALRSCMREHDGRSALDGRWSQLILGHTGVASVEGLVRWAAGATKADVAALAPAVFDAADHGVESAVTIINDAAVDLVKHVEALYDRLKPWPEPPVVAFTGGLVSPGRPLRDATLRALASRLDLPVLDRPIDAARGAAAMARQLA